MNYDDVALRVAKDIYATLNSDREKVDGFYVPGAKLVTSFGEQPQECFIENRWNGLRPGEHHIFRCDALTQGAHVIAHVSGCVTAPESPPLQCNEMIIFSAKIDPVAIAYHSVHLSPMDRDPTL